MDALSNAAKTLAMIPHRRKAVLLVSQGLPVSVEEIVTNQNAAGAAQALRDFIVTAQRSNIAVYTMDPCGLDLDEGCNIELAPEPAEPGREHRRIRRHQHQRAGAQRRPGGGGERHLLPARICVADAQRRQAAPDPRPHASSRRRGPCAGRLLLAARPGANRSRAPYRSTRSISAPIQSRGLTMRIAAVPAPLAQKPAATVAVGIEMTVGRCASAPAPSTSASWRSTRTERSARASDSGAASRPRAATPTGGFTSDRASTCRRGGIRFGWRPWRRAARSAASSRKWSCRTSAMRSRSAASRSRRLRPRRRSLPSCSPTCCRSCRSRLRRSRPAPRSWRSFPIRVSSRASGPLTIDAKLARGGGAPQSLDAPAPDVKPFAAAGGSVYTVTLPPSLEVGDYRLVVETALGREKATREVRFKVVGG